MKKCLSCGGRFSGYRDHFCSESCQLAGAQVNVTTAMILIRLAERALKDGKPQLVGSYLQGVILELKKGQ